MDVYIITLCTDVKRLEHVEQILIPSLKATNFFRDIYKLEAYVGVTNDIEYACALHNVTFTDYYWGRAKRGQLGCTLSHVNAWHIALKNDSDNFVVLEDDAIIIEQFIADLKSVVHESKTNNYDFTYLYTPAFQLRDTPQNKVASCSFITRAYNQWCTGAYLVSKKGATKLIQLFKMVGDHTDGQFSWLVKEKKVNAFACKKPLFGSAGQLCPKYQNEKLKSNIWSTPTNKKKTPSQAVPKIVHIFLGSFTPEKRAQLNSTYRGTEVRVYTKAARDQYIKNNFPSFFSSVFEQVSEDSCFKHVAFSACVLYHSGGVVLKYEQELSCVEKFLTKKGITFSVQDNIPENDITGNMISSGFHQPFWINVLASISSCVKDSGTNSPTEQETSPVLITSQEASQVDTAEAEETKLPVVIKQVEGSEKQEMVKGVLPFWIRSPPRAPDLQKVAGASPIVDVCPTVLCASSTTTPPSTPQCTSEKGGNAPGCWDFLKATDLLKKYQKDIEYIK